MKIHCKCGYTISDGTDNLSHKGHLIPDKKWHDLWDKIDNSIEKSGPSPEEKEASCVKLRSVRWARIVYQCSSCSRLYLHDQQNQLHIFCAENADVSTGLMDATRAIASNRR